MRTLTVQLSEEMAAEVDELASKARVQRDDYVQKALQLYAKLQRAKVSSEKVTQEYNAYAASCDTSLSPDEKANVAKRMKEIEW